MNRIHRPHRLIVEIAPKDGLFECSIQEPDTRHPHWVMAGPPLPYEEVVEELVQALRAHLLSPGE